MRTDDFYRLGVVTRVVDGDTYYIDVDLGFRMKASIPVRLRGIDTPEVYRPSCEAEKLHGQDATEFVRHLLEGKEVGIRTYKSGIYSRWEADILIDYQGHEDMYVAKILEMNGFAKRDSYE